MWCVLRGPPIADSKSSPGPMYAIAPLPRLNLNPTMASPLAATSRDDGQLCAVLAAPGDRGLLPSSSFYGPWTSSFSGNRTSACLSLLSQYGNASAGRNGVVGEEDSLLEHCILIGAAAGSGEGGTTPFLSPDTTYDWTTAEVTILVFASQAAAVASTRDMIAGEEAAATRVVPCAMMGSPTGAILLGPKQGTSSSAATNISSMDTAAAVDDDAPPTLRGGCRDDGNPLSTSSLPLASAHVSLWSPVGIVAASLTDGQAWIASVVLENATTTTTTTAPAASLPPSPLTAVVARKQYLQIRTWRTPTIAVNSRQRSTNMSDATQWQVCPLGEPYDACATLRLEPSTPALPIRWSPNGNSEMRTRMGRFDVVDLNPVGAAAGAPTRGTSPPFVPSSALCPALGFGQNDAVTGDTTTAAATAMNQLVELSPSYAMDCVSSVLLPRAANGTAAAAAVSVPTITMVPEQAVSSSTANASAPSSPVTSQQCFAVLLSQPLIAGSTALVRIAASHAMTAASLSWVSGRGGVVSVVAGTTSASWQDPDAASVVPPSTNLSVAAPVVGKGRYVVDLAISVPASPIVTFRSTTVGGDTSPLTVGLKFSSMSVNAGRCTGLLEVAPTSPADPSTLAPPASSATSVDGVNALMKRVALPWLTFSPAATPRFSWQGGCATTWVTRTDAFSPTSTGGATEMVNVTTTQDGVPLMLLVTATIEAAETLPPGATFMVTVAASDPAELVAAVSTLTLPVFIPVPPALLTRRSSSSSTASAIPVAISVRVQLQWLNGFVLDACHCDSPQWTRWRPSAVAASVLTPPVVVNGSSVAAMRAAAVYPTADAFLATVDGSTARTTTTVVAVVPGNGETTFAVAPSGTTNSSPPFFFMSPNVTGRPALSTAAESTVGGDGGNAMFTWWRMLQSCLTHSPPSPPLRLVQGGAAVMAPATTFVGNVTQCVWALSSVIRSLWSDPKGTVKAASINVTALGPGAAELSLPRAASRAADVLSDATMVNLAQRWLSFDRVTTTTSATTSGGGNVESTSLWLSMTGTGDNVSLAVPFPTPPSSSSSGGLSVAWFLFTFLAGGLGTAPDDCSLVAVQSQERMAAMSTAVLFPGGMQSTLVDMASSFLRRSRLPRRKSTHLWPTYDGVAAAGRSGTDKTVLPAWWLGDRRDPMFSDVTTMGSVSGSSLLSQLSSQDDATSSASPPLVAQLSRGIPRLALLPLATAMGLEVAGIVASAFTAAAGSSTTAAEETAVGIALTLMSTPAAQQKLLASTAWSRLCNATAAVEATGYVGGWSGAASTTGGDITDRLRVALFPAPAAAVTTSANGTATASTTAVGSARLYTASLGWLDVSRTQPVSGAGHLTRTVATTLPTAPLGRPGATTVTTILFDAYAVALFGEEGVLVRLPSVAIAPAASDDGTPVAPTNLNGTDAPPATEPPSTRWFLKLRGRRMGAAGGVAAPPPPPISLDAVAAVSVTVTWVMVSPFAARTTVVAPTAAAPSWIAVAAVVGSVRMRSPDHSAPSPINASVTMEVTVLDTSVGGRPATDGTSRYACLSTSVTTAVPGATSSASSLVSATGLRCFAASRSHLLPTGSSLLDGHWTFGFLATAPSPTGLLSASTPPPTPLPARALASTGDATDASDRTLVVVISVVLAGFLLVAIGVAAAIIRIMKKNRPRFRDGQASFGLLSSHPGAANLDAFKEVLELNELQGSPALPATDPGSGPRPLVLKRPLRTGEQVLADL